MTDSSDPRFNPDFRNGYGDVPLSSESLSNPYIVNLDGEGYTHETSASQDSMGRPPSQGYNPTTTGYGPNTGYAQPTTNTYPNQSAYGQPGYGVVSPQNQPMSAYGMVPAGAIPYSKNKAAAAILCFFFGGLGIHNFYTNHSPIGMAQIILNGAALFLAIFIPFIGILLALPLWLALEVWVLVNFFQILTDSGLYRQDFPRM